MIDTLSPNPNRRPKAPLPTIAAIVGVVCIVIAVAASMAPQVTRDLAFDPLVVRALAITWGVSAYMIVRVATHCAAGFRRIAAISVAVFFAAQAIPLFVAPSLATVPYARGWAMLIPWLLVGPGLFSLALSRLRVH